MQNCVSEQVKKNEKNVILVYDLLQEKISINNLYYNRAVDK